MEKTSLFALCIIFILTSASILTSCTPVKYGYIEIEKGFENDFRNITEESSYFKALKENILFIDRSDKNYEKALKQNRLLKIYFYSEYSFNPPENGADMISAAVMRELHIPVTDFRSTETSAERSDIKSGKYRTERGENISLPEKGLSFEGLYPDDENYSLFRESRVSAFIPEKISEEALSALYSWLEEIDIERVHHEKNKTDSAADEIPSSSNGNLQNPVAGTNTNCKEKITWTGSVGDIMPGRGVENILIWGKNGKEKIFSDTLPLLQGFDLLIGNLEGPVTYHKTVIEKAYNFKFRRKVLGELKNSGFDYLSAVNNHCFDYEETGFLDTLYNLERYNIKTSGAGKNLNQALTPARFNVNGTDFRILALADYPAEKDKFEGRKETEAALDKPGILWPSEKVFTAVKDMATEEGVDIVSVHAGYEWQNQPAEKQKRLYRKLADLGADIVIGSHPHVLQPVESYNGSLIVYSLGNFIFSGMGETEFGEESMILSLGFYCGRLIYINYIPVNIDGKYLSLDKSGKILKRFDELNNDFTE